MLQCKKSSRVALIVVGLAVCCGCGKQQSASPSTQPATPAAAAAWETPTDQECREYAERLEQVVLSGDVAALNAMIDWDAILDSATGGIDGVDEARNAFVMGARRTINGPRSLGGLICQNVAEGGSYRFLRTHTEGTEKRALFRLLGSGGFNYHDMVLVRQPGGEVRAIDVYVFLSAERLSKTLRRSFIPVAGEASKGILARLTGEENDLVANSESIAQMGNAVQTKQYRQVLDIYARLPASLKRDKNILSLRLVTAMQVGEDEYTAAIDAFRRYHPEDPCIDMIAIDGYVIRGQYDEARACVDRLDEAVGGDPHLDALRASLKLSEGEPQTARELANRAIEADPTLIDAYWVLVDLSLTENDFDETSRLLSLIAERFEIVFFELAQIPEYAEYVKSPQYREWLQSRADDSL